MSPAHVVMLLASGALCVAGVLTGGAPVAGGGVTLQGFWLVQLGAALALSSVVSGSSPQRRSAAVLAAAFAIGVAGQLQLTSPLWLQFLDLRPRTLMSGTGPMGVVAIAIQGLVVLALGRSRLRSILAQVRAMLTPRAFALSALLFVFCAAHASPLAARGAKFAVPYMILVAAAAGLFALNGLNVILFASAFEDRDVADWHARLTARCSLLGGDTPARPTTDARWPWALALFVLCATTAIAVFVFDRVAHIPDEGAYLFQARAFAAGRMAAPLPPVPEAFAEFLFDMRDGRWFAPTNPGWPAALAFGELVGAPWIVNPVLAAIAVPVTHKLVSRWADRGLANVITLLLATSPWFLFLAASQMTHTITFTLLVGAALLLTPLEGPRRFWSTIAAGVLLGLMVLVRPLDGLIAGIFAGLWLLATSRPRLRVVVPYSLGCILGAIWLLPFNAYFTGEPLRDPMAVYTDSLWYPGVNAIGFGADVGNVPNRWGGLDPLSGHGLPDVLLNANQNLYGLNFELFGWATGSLVLLALHVLLGRWSRADRWMIAFGIAVPAAYSLYWFSGGPDFGARYWFLVLLPCLWLSARGVVTLVERLRELLGRQRVAARVTVAIGLMLAVTITTFVPWRIAGKYKDYRGYHGDFLRMIESDELGNALVLVHATGDSDVRSALYLNDPFLPEDQPIFVRDRGPELERRLREAFPDRRVVHVLGRSLTNDRARISERRP